MRSTFKYKILDISNNIICESSIVFKTFKEAEDFGYSNLYDIEAIYGIAGQYRVVIFEE